MIFQHSGSEAVQAWVAVPMVLPLPFTFLLFDFRILVSADFLYQQHRLLTSYHAAHLALFPLLVLARLAFYWPIVHNSQLN